MIAPLIFIFFLSAWHGKHNKTRIENKDDSKQSDIK